MGIRATEVYASESNWLKAEDLKHQEHEATIAGAALVEVDNKQRIELRFVGREKKLLLNKTNADTLVYAYGDDTDGWVGKQLILYPTIAQFQGKTVPAIRVRPKLQAAAPVTRSVEQAAAPVVDPDEDIPW